MCIIITLTYFVHYIFVLQHFSVAVWYTAESIMEKVNAYMMCGTQFW